MVGSQVWYSSALVALLVVLLAGGIKVAGQHEHHHQQPTATDDIDISDGSGVPPTSSEESSEEIDDDLEIVNPLKQDLPTHIQILHTRLNRTNELQTTITEDHVEETYQSAGPWAVVLLASSPLDSAITFAANQSYLRAQLRHFHLCPGYDFSLHFRTDKPHGLLAFLKQETSGTPRDHQYIFLRHGAVAVRVVTGHYRNTFVTRTGGLQDNDWHSLAVHSSCDGDVSVTVDGVEEVFSDKGLSREPQHGDLQMWMGGVDESQSGAPLLNIHQFRGCVRSVVLRQEKVEEVAGLQPWLVTEQRGVTSALTCVDHCLAHNPCPAETRCVNHFTHASCDCSGLAAYGRHCDKIEMSILSFLGDGHLKHSLYHWRDMAHTEVLSVEFKFRTNVSDAFLMMASSEYPTTQYLSLALDNAGFLKVGGNLPNFEKNIKVVLDDVAQNMHDTPLSDRNWHHVKLTYTADDGGKLLWDPELYFGDSPNLNQVCHQPPSSGDLFCLATEKSGPRSVFHYDAAAGACVSGTYSGCGGGGNHFVSADQCEIQCKVPGLWSRLPFVGCMRGIYVNNVSVLGALGQTGTGYTGYMQDDKTKCHESSNEYGLSLTTPRSAVYLSATTDSATSTLSLALEFRPLAMVANTSQGVVAKGTVLMAETVDQWMLYSDGAYLHFKLDNDLINLRSTNQIKENDWNKVVLHQTLTSLGTTVSLLLNGQPVSEEVQPLMEFVSGVTLGSQMAGLRSCYRSVVVDRRPIDLRRHTNADTGVVFDRCQPVGHCGSPSGGCQHKKCPCCGCSGSGYEGNKCQFAKYPTSCEQYRHHGFNTSGRYKIDYDGDGPMTPIAVICHFEETITKTEYMHNIPDSYAVRKQGLKTHRLLVQYAVPSDHLYDLVKTSVRCQQSISFNCTRARLRLSTETWFSSPQRRMFSNFGTDTPAICPCRVEDKCVKRDIPCNCDANDGLLRTDSAVITKPDQLPVTSFNFIVDQMTMNHKSLAQLTLGNLICEKENEPEDAVSLLNSEGFLELFLSQNEKQIDLRSIGFAFRTSAPSATIMHKPAVHTRHADYRVILKSANKLEFQYLHRDRREVVTFHTSYRLNSGAWQNVWIDLSPSEIRITLNGHSKFINLMKTHAILEGDIYLGGTPRDIYASVYPDPTTPGLIGCLRDFEVNQERISLEDLIKRSPIESYNIGCKLSCDPNPCENGAQCLEGAEGSYQCVCSNQHAHSGNNCHKNLNFNSVTFLNSDTEMRYKSTPDKPIDPLKLNITLGFRTRSLQALLLFTKDHIQNLVQIYLAKPNELSLIWNSGYSLQNIVINTGDLDLNEGNLVQVHVARSRSSTKLFVQCQSYSFMEELDVGVNLMTEDEYQQFPFGSEVPHAELTLYENTMELPDPALLLYLGGATREGLHAKVPGLVGCLSGFRVGHQQIKLEDRNRWSWNQFTYEIGCYSACMEEKVCHNGGVCLAVFNSVHGDRTQCRCDHTSYVGDHCDQEIAFDFNGQSSIIFKKKYAIFKEPFTVDFAFSLKQHDETSTDTEALVLLRDVPDQAELYSPKIQPHDALAIGLKSSNILTVVRHSGETGADLVITGNLHDINVTDGHRYHLTIAVNQDQISIKINGDNLRVAEDVTNGGYWPLTNEVLIVGGIGYPLHQGESISDWTNFHGCVSNVQFRTRSKKVYRPFFDYDTNVEDLVSYERIGLPNRTTCSTFQDKTSKIVAHNYADYQESPLLRMAPSAAPQTEPFQPLQPTDEEYNDGSGMRTAGTIGALIMAAVALFTLIYLCKISKKGKENETTSNDDKVYQMVEVGDLEERATVPGKHLEVTSVPSSEKMSLEETKPLMQSSTEATEVKSNIVAEKIPSSDVEYVKETSALENITKSEPKQQTAAEDTQDTLSREVEDGNVESKIDDKLGKETGVIIIVDLAADSDVTEDVIPSHENNDCEITDDTVLEKSNENEMEKSLTKIIDNTEEIPVESSSYTNSSSSTSSSSSSSSTKSNDEHKGTEKLTEPKKESNSKKKKQKNNKSKSGSYVINTDDGPMDVTDAELPTGPAPPKPERSIVDDPKIISASEKEKMTASVDEVEVIDAQKFFASRKTPGSPAIPPKSKK